MPPLAKRLALTLVAALAGSGCGGPVLQNVPKPNTAVAAGIVAGAAAAATLAAPDAAAAKQEQKRPEKGMKGVKNGPTVPADVLDRLDEKNKQAGSGSADAEPAPAAAPDETTGVKSPIPLKP